MATIYAHRGVSAEYPENTIQAFRRAIELGVDGIELDVHLSRDGVPVVMHNDTVDETTNGTGAIADSTLDELRALDAGGGQAVPTLEEVLHLVADHLHVDIEVKAAAAGLKVLEVTDRIPGLRFAISSFNHDVLREIAGVRPEVDLWPLSSVVSTELFSTAKELGSRQLALFEGMLNSDIVGECLDHGFAVWAWTVNDPVRAKALIESGVTGICTDNPALISDGVV